MIQQLESSYIELSPSAYRNNLRFLKRKLGPDVLFSSVVKGNAYGHGIETFIPLAEAAGVRHFSVFDAHEAYRVHQARTADSEIMIMGMIPNEALPWAIENEISFYVFDFERLYAAGKAAEKLGKPARIHLEVETGLNRTGFAQQDLSELAKILKQHAGPFMIEGLCTHYAGAESIRNYWRVQQQIARFTTICEMLPQYGIRPRYQHTACSAAAISYPETQMDMVRIGIVQYGFWPSEETYIQYLTTTGGKEPNPLRRVISWKSHLMSVKNVIQGEFIGYGTTFQAPQDMRVAVIPVGYANGYSRSLSNQGQVLIQGKRCPVIGLVNMSLSIVDISNAPQAQPGDEVVLIGKQKKGSISVSSFSEFSNQLNYELLTRLPQNIPRYIVK